MFELSQKELAEMTGKTTRQIRNWEKDGLPCRAEGNKKLYPARAAILHWHKIEVAKAIENAEASESQALRTRKLEAETEGKEYELERLRGTLVPVAFMDSEFDEVCSRMRNEIEGMAPRYAADVRPEDPGAGELVLDKIAEELLTALAGVLSAVGGDEDDRAA